MNKNRNIFLGMAVVVAVSGCLQSQPSIPGESQKSSTSLANRLKAKYAMLKDDWKCLFDRKRTCTWQQRTRIVGELVALVMLVYGSRKAAASYNFFRSRQIDESLFQAAYDGDLNAVEKAIRWGANPDAEVTVHYADNEAKRLWGIGSWLDRPYGFSRGTPTPLTVAYVRQGEAKTEADKARYDKVIEYLVLQSAQKEWARLRRLEHRYWLF